MPKSQPVGRICQDRRSHVGRIRFILMSSRNRAGLFPRRFVCHWGTLRYDEPSLRRLRDVSSTSSSAGDRRPTSLRDSRQCFVVSRGQPAGPRGGMFVTQPARAPRPSGTTCYAGQRHTAWGAIVPQGFYRRSAPPRQRHNLPNNLVVTSRILRHQTHPCRRGPNTIVPGPC